MPNSRRAKPRGMQKSRSEPSSTRRERDSRRQQRRVRRQSQRWRGNGEVPGCDEGTHRAQHGFDRRSHGSGDGADPACGGTCMGTRSGILQCLRRQFSVTRVDEPSHSSPLDEACKELHSNCVKPFCSNAVAATLPDLLNFNASIGVETPASDM